jgi:hypothetical protein
MQRFHRDDQVLVRGVLRDLVESGLVFSNGSGAGAIYRAVREDELSYIRKARPDNGADELLWAVIYREGPLLREQLEARGGVTPVELEPSLMRLVGSGRVQQDACGAYVAAEFFVAEGATVGWEAAVFDHYHALVKTICCRLNPDPELEIPSSAVGGSTYTFDVWPDHPLYPEVIETLSGYRSAQSELRRRVEEYNSTSSARSGTALRVVTYAGQCVLRSEGDEDERARIQP